MAIVPFEIAVPELKNLSSGSAVSLPISVTRFIILPPYLKKNIIPKIKIYK